MSFTGKKRKLTYKQNAFVKNYIIHKNAAEAARQAKYSSQNPDIIGYQLLQNPLVRAAIDEEIKKQEIRTEITADYVLRGLKEVADRCRAGKLDSNGANRALELLGKHLALFVDRNEISGRDGHELKIQICDSK